MESDGAINIFERSLRKYGLYYTSFYEDGDRKSFLLYKKYMDKKSINKFECIGHYQKRVGNRLRK